LPTGESRAQACSGNRTAAPALSPQALCRASARPCVAGHPHEREIPMHSIIYLVGLIVVVLALLSLVGLA
jgi:hypothetical protein